MEHISPYFFNPSLTYILITIQYCYPHLCGNQSRMIMRFSIREWRRFYDKVHELGKTLHDGRPTYDELGDYIEPVAELSKEAQMALESQIKTLTQRSSRYLEQCGIRSHRRLWQYDSKNPETQMSSPQFKYGHLLENILNE